MERPATLLYHDEFKVEELSSSEITADNVASSFSDQASSFSFCVASLNDTGPHFPSPFAYADEIFHNGKIRPLHSGQQPFEAITVFAHLPYAETLTVRELFHPSSAPCSPSHNTLSRSLATHSRASSLPCHHEPARASLDSHASVSHTHHRHAHLTRTHYSLDHELSPAAAYPPDQHSSDTARAGSLHPSIPEDTDLNADLARATTRFPSAAPKHRRAFSFFTFNRSGCRDEQVACPSNRDSFTPTRFKDPGILTAHSTSHLSNMKKLKSDSFPTTKAAHCQIAPQFGNMHLGKYPQQANLQLKGPSLYKSQKVSALVHNYPSPPSSHEAHYNAHRAHKESMKRRTSLPYRHGLFACIGY